MKNKISFGWNLKTHSYITKKAFNKVSRVIETPLKKKTLVEYTKRPDFDEAFNLNEWHFFDPFFKYLKKDKNAKTQFIGHAQKGIRLAKEGKFKKASKSFGRMLHYGCDILVPAHTQRLTVQEKLAQAIKHMSFEQKALEYQKELINFKKPIAYDENISLNNFIETFIEKRAFASRARLEDSFSKDTEKSKETIKVSLQEAFDSSVELLHRISKEITVEFH